MGPTDDEEFANIFRFDDMDHWRLWARELRKAATDAEFRTLLADYEKRALTSRDDIAKQHSAVCAKAMREALGE